MLPTPRTRNSAFARVGFAIGLSILLAGLAWNAPLIFDQIAPAAVTYDVPIHVTNSPLHAGDVLKLEVGRTAWNITGTAPVPAEVSRQLVRTDAEGDVLSPKTVRVLGNVTLGVDPGHSVVHSELSIIDTNTPAGYWRLEGVATARHKSSPYYTDPIEVLN